MKKTIKITLTLVVDGCEDVLVDVQTEDVSSRPYTIDINEAVDEFLKEKTREVVGSKVYSGVLYTTYQKWAKDKNNNALDRRSFGLQLKRLGHTNSRDGKGKYRWNDLVVV